MFRRPAEVAAAALAFTAVVVATAGAGPAAEPSGTGPTPQAVSQTALQTIPLPRSGSGRTAVNTGELEVDPFELAAVTWTGDAELTASVRIRTDGQWSEWYELPAEADHAPDAGTAEAANARNGTDPLIVPSSDAVQVRVAEAAPGQATDLRLDLVNPGELPADAVITGAAHSGARAFGSAARPAIHSRAQWGADESLRADPPEYGEVRGAFVHHTVNANDYTEADVPAMIRSMYLYHVRSRGWNDIGYNFIVDKFGGVWEGRHGGVDRAVVGAHTYGYNDDAFAMSALGTYTDTPPSTRMLRAYQQLFAWKFTIHNIDPRRQVSYDGESWPAIAGHRDAAATACPGDALYRQLGTIRRGTITEMGLAPSRDFERNWLPDLVATRFDGTMWLAQGKAGGFHNARQIGRGWQGMSAIVAAGDWDGDTEDDLLARRTTDGTLWLYAGRGDGSFRSPQRIGGGWQAMSGIMAAGDWDGDGRPDLLARRGDDGSLWLYPGNGQGGFRTARRIGTGWAGMKAILVPGDWTGNGTADIIAMRPDGTLWLYPGTGGGAVGASQQIGNSWLGYRLIHGGDVDVDGFADVVAVAPDGTLRLFPGNGRGGFERVVTIGSGWAGFSRLV